MGLQSGNRLLQVQSSVRCNTVCDIQNKILSDTIHNTSKWIVIFTLVNFIICVRTYSAISDGPIDSYSLVQPTLPPSYLIL